MTWEERFVELMERIQATAVAQGDPRPLREELNKLLAERPPEKNDGTSES